MDGNQTYSKFTQGIDQRYIENESDPNGFEDLHNCHVNTMNRIEKRPGIREDVQATADTVGLFTFNGRLWTIFAPGSGTVTTQPQPVDGTEFWVLDLDHGRSGDIIKVHSVNVYLGGLYIVVEYDEQIPADNPPPQGDGGPGINVIQHFYVVTDAEVWTAGKEFINEDPEGFRVVATASVDTPNKIFHGGVFYEAFELGLAKNGDTQPVWPTADPEGGEETALDGDIIWTSAPLNERVRANAEAFSYNENGVYCYPDNYYQGTGMWRAWLAINIEEGQTLLGAEDNTLQFDTEVGSITIDGEILWECVFNSHWKNTYTYDIAWPEDPDGNNTQYAHSMPTDINLRDFIYYGKRESVETGATEPDPWSVPIGGITFDGDIKWETKTTLITDPVCPNSAEVLVHQSKVYALGSHLEIPTNEDGLHIDSVEEADIVRFCATTDPFDWQAEDDAGFLATGVQASGSEVARALGKYNDQLAVLMEDNIQTWAVDPDPQRNALVQVVGDIGTRLSETVVNIGTDLIFLSTAGFRSLGQQKEELIVHDTDIGSPIDQQVVAAVNNAERPSHITATHYSRKSQMWCSIGNDVYCWTWSRTSKVNSWARFTMPDEIDYFANLNNKLYMRGHSDKILYADNDIKVDYDGEFPMTIEFGFQSCKSPGIMKQFQAVDCIANGQAELSFKFDPNNPDAVTPSQNIEGNTRSGQLRPIEVCATEIAPVLYYKGPNDLQVDSLTLYFNRLGLV